MWPVRWRVLTTGLVVLAFAGHVPSVNAQHGASAVLPRTGSLVFDGVTVIDVEQGKLIPGQRVVVVGNRIQAVGAAQAVKLPRGAQVVEARGKYLIPGLWDLHVHANHIALPPLVYKHLLANGVTGVRMPGVVAPIDSLRRWRREILAGARIGPPRQVIIGPYIENGPDMARYVRHITDPAEAGHLVDSLKAAGADMLKFRDIDNPALYFALASAARRTGIPFGGHLPPSLTELEVSDSGARLIDHMPSLLGPRCFTSHDHDACHAGSRCFGASATVEQCRPVADRLRRNDTWIVPTQYVYHTDYGMMGLGHGRGNAIGRHVREAVPIYVETLTSTDSAPTRNWLRGTVLPDSLGVMSVAQRAGLPLVAGTDVGTGPDAGTWLFDGFSLHAELAMGVAEGLTPLNALQAATLNPAKMLHATDSLGTVAAGKLADLVLLDADPLVDITNTTMIRAVVADGRYYDRAALDRVLRDTQVEGAEAKARARKARAEADNAETP